MIRLRSKGSKVNLIPAMLFGMAVGLVAFIAAILSPVLSGNDTPLARPLGATLFAGGTAALAFAAVWLDELKQAIRRRTNANRLAPLAPLVDNREFEELTPGVMRTKDGTLQIRTCGLYANVYYDRVDLASGSVTASFHIPLAGYEQARGVTNYLFYASVHPEHEMGRGAHYRGLPPEASRSDAECVSLPPARFAVIVQVRRETFLLRLTAEGSYCGDTWHSDIQDAKTQASFEFEDGLSEWRQVPPETRDIAKHVRSITSRQPEGSLLRSADAVNADTLLSPSQNPKPQSANRLLDATEREAMIRLPEIRPTSEDQIQ